MNPQAAPHAINQPLANELEAAPQTNGIQRLSWNQPQKQQQQHQHQGPSPQPSPRLMTRQPDNFANSNNNKYASPFPNMLNNSQHMASPPDESSMGYSMQMQRPVEADGQERQPARYGAAIGGLTLGPLGYGAPVRKAVSRDVSRERPTGEPAGGRYVGLRSRSD